MTRGIHHVTAISGPAKRNHDFYTRTLGLRFVKKTVNFDDPGAYHFYYGDEAASPGAILTKRSCMAQRRRAGRARHPRLAWRQSPSG
jgi:catechol 2,3-dioxygenase-like lactoylglutathione lyase family enzyme